MLLERRKGGRCVFVSLLGEPCQQELAVIIIHQLVVSRSNVPYTGVADFELMFARFWR